MTNKPMLSVERELLDIYTGRKDGDWVEAGHELRALLDKPAECRCKRYGKDNPHWPCPVHAEPAAQHQGEPVAQSEFEPDAICLESDGCPTEGAVLKRFWRENQPDPVLCEFYEAEDFPSLVRELVGHVAQLQEAAKRNVKPWEDTFPPTLLPAYIARINAEHPDPVAPVAVAHTMRSVMEAYAAARKEHLTGTSNFCAAMAARLNGVNL